MRVFIALIMIAIFANAQDGAKKLVFVGPGALRIGVYLQLEDRLAGIEQAELSTVSPPTYRKVLDQNRLKSLPIIGSGGVGKMPNFEALIATKTDLIVASFLSPAEIDLIEQKTKIPVLAISYGASYGAKSGKKLDAVLKSILTLGEITGKSARAHELVSFMENEKNYLKSLNIPEAKLYIGGVAYKGAQGITSTEADYLPFELLGQKNAMFDGEIGHKFVDLEAIIRLDPEWIFLDNHSKNRWQSELNLLSKLKAHKNNQIKTVLGLNNYNTNIENSFVIAHQIASDLMGVELDSARIHQIYKIFFPQVSPEVFD